MARLRRLEDEPPSLGCRTRPLGHLGQRLVATFRGPEVRSPDHPIGIQYPDERDLGAKGGLRSYPRGDVYVRGVHVRKLVDVLEDVGIDPHHPGAWERRRDLLFQPLAPNADESERARTTARAHIRGPAGVPAPDAANARGAAVVEEARLAHGAAGGSAALRAPQRPRVAPSRDQKSNPPPVPERPPDAIVKRVRDGPVLLRFDHLDDGTRRALGYPVGFHGREPSGLGRGAGFQRRGRG